MDRTKLDKGEGTSTYGAKVAAPDEAFGTDLLVDVAQMKLITDAESDEDNNTTKDTSSHEEKIPQTVKMRATYSVPDKERKLGRKAFKNREFEKAASHFQRAIELNPKESAFYFRMSETKFEQGKYEEVIQFCTKAVKVGKENKGSVKTVAASQVLRGRAWKKQGKEEKAKADIEKAINFLTSIALVKLEKGRYFEALDFIIEAFLGDMMSLIKEEDWTQSLLARERLVAFQYKVCLGYLSDYVNSHTPDWVEGELSRFNLSTRQGMEGVFLQEKIFGDRAFKKNKHKVAMLRYTTASLVFPNEMTSFLTKYARMAEENKKWELCNELCIPVVTLLLSSPISCMIQGEVDANLTEMRAMKSKANRRIHGLGEDVDKKFAELLAARNVCDDSVVITERMMKNNPKQGRLVEMADLSGSGMVTVQEFNLFVKCLNVSK